MFVCVEILFSIKYVLDNQIHLILIFDQIKQNKYKFGFQIRKQAIQTNLTFWEKYFFQLRIDWD